VTGKSESDAIQFDPEAHKYTRKVLDSKGSYQREIPGVTSLLAGAGISSPFLNDERARDFGTKGHKIVRLFLMDDLGSYDPAFEPWMEGLRQFRKDCNPNKWLCLDDTIVHSEKYGYCGMPDYLGRATIVQMGRKEADYLLDWKFWASATRGQVDDADIQSSAYAKAAVEMRIVTTLPRRAVVHFVPGTYHIEPLTDPSAWPTFLSALNIRRWKERHR